MTSCLVAVGNQTAGTWLWGGLLLLLHLSSIFTALLLSWLSTLPLLLPFMVASSHIGHWRALGACLVADPQASRQLCRHFICICNLQAINLLCIFLVLKQTNNVTTTKTNVLNIKSKLESINYLDICLHLLLKHDTPLYIEPGKICFSHFDFSCVGGERSLESCFQSPNQIPWHWQPLLLSHGWMVERSMLRRWKIWIHGHGRSETRQSKMDQMLGLVNISDRGESKLSNMPVYEKEEVKLSNPVHLTFKLWNETIKFRNKESG